MNAEQKERVKAIIREDATGRYGLYRLRGEEEEYCVLGGLGHAIGVTPAQMSGAGPLGFTKTAWAKIGKWYGLTPLAAWTLVKVNDAYFELEQRRGALLAEVDRQPTTE